MEDKVIRASKKEEDEEDSLTEKDLMSDDRGDDASDGDGNGENEYIHGIVLQRIFFGRKI